MANIPSVLADLSANILAQFDSDWAASRHRCPKCSKADFAAGWRTAMERNWWRGRVRKPAAPSAEPEQVDESDGPGASALTDPERSASRSVEADRQPEWRPSTGAITPKGRSGHDAA